MTVDAVVWAVTHPLFPALTGIMLGWLFRGAFMRWRHGPWQNRIDLVHEGVLYQLAANRAVDYLNDRQRTALEEEVNAALEEHGYDTVTCEIEERQVYRQRRRTEK